MTADSDRRVSRAEPLVRHGRGAQAGALRRRTSESAARQPDDPDGAFGSGKTTVLTLMGCLRDVQDGSVRLLGQELNGAGTSAAVACAAGWGSSSRPTTCTKA
jgi:hypothetical protein